jgi:hypothetical protein
VHWYKQNTPPHPFSSSLARNQFYSGISGPVFCPKPAISFLLSGSSH